MGRLLLIGALACVVGCSEDVCEIQVSDVGGGDAPAGIGPNGPNGPDCSRVYDGVMTELPEGCPPEWGQPCELSSSHVHVEYNGGWLHVLLDWRVRDIAPIDPDQYGWFGFITADGNHYEVRIYGTGFVEVTRNGWPYPAIEGAVGFGPSTEMEADHVGFEFSVDIPPGEFYMVMEAPRNAPSSGSPDNDLIHVASLRAVLESGFVFSPCGYGNAFALIAVNPPRGIGGDKVRLRGMQFGDTPGKVTMGGQSVEILSWAHNTIDVVVPDINKDVLVRVRRADGEVSNPVLFYFDCTIHCEPSCDPNECPGKPCGICPEPTECVDGECLCVPKCEGKKCGDDGCGGVCGTCSSGLQCVEGICMCVPSCGGGAADCGPDGCGGVCGTCVEGDVCNKGVCCEPKCNNKQCGDDSCGGSCGSCPPDYECTGGSCICVPDCDGKQCGPDGCGAVCGNCVGKFTCDVDQCKCIPNCINDETGSLMVCGDDGCGGSCGECLADEKCTKIGQCVFDN